MNEDEFKTQPSGEALLQHADWLRRLARSLVQDAAERDDLVQETWLAALRSRAVDGRPLEPWLRTVARNFSRRSSRRREQPTADPAQGKIDPGLPDPSDVAEKLEAERRLTDALATLDEPFRSTLFLRFYEDLSSTEIAARTSSPAGTVRWRLKRGLELLRERLDEESSSGAWLGLLLPLAVAGSPGSAAALAAGTGAAASPIAALLGALAMNTMIKALVAALVLALFYVGLDQASVLPDSLSMRARSVAEPVMVASEEMVPVESLEARRSPPELIDVPEPERSSVTAPFNLSSPAAPAEVREPGPWLTAILMDDQGRPIPGALLSVESTVTDVRSDSRGRIRADLGEAPDELERWNMTFTRDGYATHARREIRAVGEDLDLGEIVLEPGGSIRGRVVDTSGRSVSGARIDYVGGVELSRNLEAKRFQYRADSVPFALTDSDGQFQIDGLLPGVVRLWATTKGGHMPEYSEGIEVRAGMTEGGVVMTLQPLLPENSLRIRVYGPQGEPAARARVDYSHSSTLLGVQSQGNVFTDEEGRVEFALFSDVVFNGQITDAAEECSPALLVNLRTGPDEVRIDLAGKQYAQFAVRDDNGITLNEYRYEIRGADDGPVLLKDIKTIGSVQPPSFVVPSDSFEIWVYAPLFKVGKSGTINPKSTGGIAIELEKIRGLRGLVKSQKAPLAGATVSLHQAVPGDEEFERNGFRCRYDPAALDTVRTDAEGRFILSAREPGEYVVRADADGFAASDTLAFELGESLESEDLQLQLERGGAIEGRVLSQENIADTVVGISRGDGTDRTARVSEAGSFRFEGLTAGPWRVRLRETEIDPHSTTISRRSGGRIQSFESIDWDCEVVPGETTYFDVDPLGRAEKVYSGQLIVDGGLPGSWGAQLLPEDAFFAEGNNGDWIALDEAGRFDIACAEVGPRLLVLRSAGSGANEIYLTSKIDTEKDSSWSFELRSGSLLFTGAPSGMAQGIPQLVMRRQGTKGVDFWATVIGDENGICEVPFAPTGRGVLLRPDFTKYPDVQPSTWPELADFTIVRGTETTVEIPN